MEFLASLSAKAYQHNILQDVILICFVSFIFASLFYGMLRSKSVTMQWNQIGTVPVDHIGPVDIAVATGVTLLLTFQFLLPYKAPPVDEAAKATSNFLLIFGFMIYAAMAGFLCFILSIRKPVSECFGLLRGNIAWIVVGSIIAYIAMFAFIITIENGFHLNDWLKARLGEQQLQGVVTEVINATDLRLAILIFGACVVAPVCEEIIFRGYLYSVTKRYTGPVFAAICTGVIFGAVHGEVWVLISLSALGIILALAYEITGSLWTCILTHCLFNSINVFFMTNPHYAEEIKNKAGTLTAFF